MPLLKPSHKAHLITVIIFALAGPLLGGFFIALPSLMVLWINGSFELRDLFVFPLFAVFGYLFGLIPAAACGICAAWLQQRFLFWQGASMAAVAGFIFSLAFGFFVFQNPDETGADRVGSALVLALPAIPATFVTYLIAFAVRNKRQ